MTMKVLQAKEQIASARKTLRQEGVSVVSGRLRAAGRRLGMVGGLPIGDELKSWDVLLTLRFLQENVDKVEPILDIGCFASELIISLHKAGYSELTGIDLNVRLHEMPYGESIKYVEGNFMHTHFPSQSFAAITAISVIEHGFSAPVLFEEMSRLLRPGGSFIASFDYWPDKIDTSGTKFFGLDWLIFSKTDVMAMIEQAAAFGLRPVGQMEYGARERPIRAAGRGYTFGWIVLQKEHVI